MKMAIKGPTFLATAPRQIASLRAWADTLDRFGEQGRQCFGKYLSNENQCACALGCLIVSVFGEEETFAHDVNMVSYYLFNHAQSRSGIHSAALSDLAQILRRDHPRDAVFSVPSYNDLVHLPLGEFAKAVRDLADIYEGKVTREN